MATCRGSEFSDPGQQRQKRILIIDDELDIAIILHLAFEQKPSISVQEFQEWSVRSSNLGY